MRIPAFLKIRPVSLTWPVRAALLFAAYFVIAKLGLRFATIGESISPVWPPTGFAIAALLLLGWRYWPAILAAAFLANATTQIPLLAAAAIACGNTGEALVGAYLMRGRGRSVRERRHRCSGLGGNGRACLRGRSPAGVRPVVGGRRGGCAYGRPT